MTLSKAKSKYETTRKELLAVVFGLKYLLGRHFVIRTDHVVRLWLRRTPEPMPHLARWITFIEQFDYEVVHWDRTRHRNADGLSCRPPEAEKSIEDTKDDKADEASETDVRVVTQNRRASVLVGDNFAQLQQNDAELEATVRINLAVDEAPTHEDLQTETELMKKMMTKWDELKVYNGLLFRNRDSPKKGKLNFSQLPPQSKVDEALRLCYAGTVGGHFRIRKRWTK